MRRRGPIARPTSQPARGGSRACGRCGRCGRKEVIRQAVVRSWPSPVAKGRHLGCKHLLIAKIQNLERTLEGDVVSEGGHAVGGAGSRGRLMPLIESPQGCSSKVPTLVAVSA
jgi:hypothetical protein